MRLVTPAIPFMILNRIRFVSGASVTICHSQLIAVDQIISVDQSNTIKQQQH